MKEVLLARGVKKLVESNGRVRAGERVVVVTDYAMTDMAERPELFQRCGTRRGAQSERTSHRHHVRR
jgi:hypothetical protein